MSLDGLLCELSRLGVQLTLKGDRQLAVSAPKGQLAEALLQHIRGRKAELVEWLARSEAPAIEEALPVIVPDRKHLHDPFPLADLQTAFAMGDSEHMEYHVRPHYYIETEAGDLDVERYERALNTALHRQRDNLLTLTDDMQLRCLPTFTPVRLQVLDLRGLAPEQAQQALLATRERMSRQTLPLDHWPWFDFAVSLYGEGQSRLHLNNNNFFSDGWGTYKLLADAQQLYDHPDTTLHPLSLSYRDCVLALARLEQSERGERSRQYWMQRLPHLPAPPALPMRAGFDPRQRSRLQRREAVLPAALWSAFKRAAQSNGLTPSNALFAVQGEVLSRWSGSRHFLLNNMVTHRFPLHPEVKEVIGNFASLYPLEVDWRDAESFGQRARKLQVQVGQDIQHVYWSGVKVLQALNQVQKTPGRAPCPFVVGSGLFMQALERPVYGCLETPQAVLDNQFWELKDGSFWVVWDLIEARFPEGMVDAMWAAYKSLLTRLAEDAGAWSQPSFDMLPAQQRQRRELVNTTAAALPAGLLHEGLALSARRVPHRLAVITPRRKMTYAQLHCHANRLAHGLRNAGVRPGDRVAIVLDKGWEQVVAAYGALSAGAVYVPIDPDWPQARIQMLLGSVQAAHVITRHDVRARLQLPEGVRAWCVDDSELGRYPGTTPMSRQQPGDAAYIIFTSGSTGTPKGVTISHQGALNTVYDINRRFAIQERDVVFGISSLCFDLSVYDLFGPLALGATLVLPAPGEAPSPQEWIEAVNEHGVSVWNSVPALMQLLVDAAQAEGNTMPTLRNVMLSGDWIPVTLPAQISQVAPQAQVISLGGATEASIWSIHHRVERGAVFETSVPYGLPLANQRWHVLHDDGHDAPDWVPGHLYVAGSGLALGYWQDEQKTRAAFVPHPITGERLYRTGDLGRYLPDGSIEFLGRADFQVKVQGYRVELGEIELALLEHPGVQAAAVIASGSAAGKQLMAFAVPVGGAPQDTDAVLSSLRGRLPAYMVPGILVWLEQLPLTPNGKIDRQALLSRGPAVEAQRAALVAPRTLLESALAAIWEEVLGVRPIGVHDDFFELGGQSFAAVQVMTRIAHQIGQRLSIGALLEGRTVASLAGRLQEHQGWSPLVAMRTEGEGRPCFFVHPAGGNVLCYRALAEGLGRPFHGLQAAGLHGEQPPLDRIEAMACLYVQALRKVQARGPYVLGGWSSGGLIAFEMARQLEREGEHVEQVLMLDSPAPLQHKPVDGRQLTLWFLQDLDIGFDPSAIDPAELPEGTPQEQLAAALELAGQRQGVVAAIELEALNSIHAVFRDVIHATRAYRPAQPSLKVDITVLRASEGQVGEFADHPDALAADWGWGRFTRGNVRSHSLPGNHYSMLKTHADAVLGVLRHAIAPQALQSTAPEAAKLQGATT